MADSSTGGYLLPTDTILTDDALEDLLQSVVVGITGLPGPMVRPRWQDPPPSLPPVTADWCAIGAIEFRTTGTAAFEHLPDADDGLGVDELTRWEHFDVIASFYGPNSQRYASRYRDGLQVAQNREAMWLNGNIVVQATLDLENRPDLRNDQWVGRYDVRTTFARAITRTYTVRNLVEADGTLTTDTGVSTDFTVTVQP